MKHLVILLSACCIIFSCSKDACEGVSCANGDCNDGSCACDVGWKGDLCDQVDFNFVGSYQAVNITYTDCDSNSDNGIWRVDNNKNFCYPDGSNTICFAYKLDLKADGTFKQIWIDTKISGGFTTSEQDPSEGTYTTTDKEVILCSPAWSSCETLTINSEITGVDWLISGRGSTGCLRTYSIIKE